MIHAIRSPKIYTSNFFVFPSYISVIVSKNFKANFASLSHIELLSSTNPFGPQQKDKKGVCGAYRLVFFFEKKKQKNTAKEKFRFSNSQNYIYIYIYIYLKVEV